jgi:hypothetical protein
MGPVIITIQQGQEEEEIHILEVVSYSQSN